MNDEFVNRIERERNRRKIFVLKFLFGPHSNNVYEKENLMHNFVEDIPEK